VRAPRVAPTSEYATAVRLFERGELAAATTALRSFIAHHADDARAEDAGYLLVLVLQRSGDTSVREAARAYLERFPNGFRRAEVEQLAR
jgi:TolA-binding protein